MTSLAQILISVRRQVVPEPVYPELQVHVPVLWLQVAFGSHVRKSNAMNARCDDEVNQLRYFIIVSSV